MQDFEPVIRWKRPKKVPCFTDSFGYRVFVGDEVFILGNDIYKKDELSYDAVKILQKHGKKAVVTRRWKKDEKN